MPPRVSKRAPIESMLPREQNCSLLNLPAELRIAICTYALRSDTRIKIGRYPAKVPPLLRTCRQIRDDAMSIFYSENTFWLPECDTENDLSLFRHLARQDMLKYLQEVHLFNEVMVTRGRGPVPYEYALVRLWEIKLEFEQYGIGRHVLKMPIRVTWHDAKAVDGDLNEMGKPVLRKEVRWVRPSDLRGGVHEGGSLWDRLQPLIDLYKGNEEKIGLAMSGTFSLKRECCSNSTWTFDVVG